jgi:hypothetical protein
MTQQQNTLHHGGTMRSHLIIPIISLVSGLIIFSCQGNKTVDPIVTQPTGMLTHASACKSNDPTTVAKQVMNSVQLDSECFSYEYDSYNTLKIKHTNAVLNCCGEMSGTVSITGDTILISEGKQTEGGLMCGCLCLFDPEYSITSLPPRSYLIMFSTQFMGVVDLAKNRAGQYCEERTGYPYQMAE